MIGSSLLMVAHIKTLWGDFSMIGFFGYILAGLFGIWLIIDMIRSGKL